MKNTPYPSASRLSGDEIRLVKIRPGEWSDQIRCDLLVESLSDVRPYHALSYVWGSNKVTRPLLLNNCIYHVTVNLESALRHLRHQLKITFLWIDALCIDQTNDDERTHQVGIMGPIYKSCQSVLVYLGDGIGHHERLRNSLRDGPIHGGVFLGDDKDNIFKGEKIALSSGITTKPISDTLEIFSFIRTLSNARHLDEVAVFQVSPDAKAESSKNGLFEALRQLMYAPFTPWWTRIWVVQEVILPRKVTLVCGTVSASWEMFAQAASNCLHHSQKCCASILYTVPRDSMNVLQGFCRLIIDLEHMRRSFAVSSDQTNLTVAARESRSLLSLLRRFRARQASDPRDKVYALLSLVIEQGVRSKLRPDYASSEREVFTHATLTSIYDSGSLSVLHTDLSRKCRHDLPSWVPDWEAPGHFGDSLRPDPLYLYDTCASWPVNEETIESSGNVLAVGTKHVDYVLKVAPTMLSEEPDSVAATLLQWLQLGHSYYYSLQIAGEENKESGSRRDRLRTLWRVFCADVVTDPGGHLYRFLPTDESKFDVWSQFSHISPFKDYMITGGSFVSRDGGMDSQLPVRDAVEYITPDAEYLRGLLIQFERSVMGEDPSLNADIFGKLFPDQKTRAALIRNAMEMHPGFRQYDPARVYWEDPDNRFLFYYKLEDFIEWATQSCEYITNRHGDSPLDGWYRSISEQEIKIKQRCVWKAVKWLSVFEDAAPLILQKLPIEVRVEHDPLKTQISDIDHSIMSATKSRCLFITKGHCIGLGPAAMMPGDSICIIKGGRTPFILRSKNPVQSAKEVCLDEKKPAQFPDSTLSKNISELKGQYSEHVRSGARMPEVRGYELIGDCYAHGLMDEKTLDGEIARIKARILQGLPSFSRSEIEMPDWQTAWLI